MPKTTRRSVDQLALDLLGKSIDQVNRAEARVLDLVHFRRLTSRDANALAAEEASFGDRLADKVASIGGSWGFIIFFAVVLASWMLLNSGVPAVLDVRFDPYPFIFLNLVLSTLAAVQAPIIMMSQNRSSEKDRIAAKLDYEVNLRNELEIMRLHEKLDALTAALDAKSDAAAKDQN
ncbi:DUF1003 domain-containing protein [Sphingomicrobium lutaoense]|uniref:Putative membrane protein n=1 Tax=Sphingomicrobium lutaoense TaxID=515949 RepID=A0A839Z355_9SPHN|nr:DUF1003 domain-containing protein [Sphingomicrobium lutaoense]MBB3763014.1 putative membrane protein [Sphingomicrobium lutaoense]